MELKNTTPFTTTLKKVRYSGTRLMKEVKESYTENEKTYVRVMFKKKPQNSSSKITSEVTQLRPMPLNRLSGKVSGLAQYVEFEGRCSCVFC